MNLKHELNGDNCIKILATDEAKDIYEIIEKYATKKGYDLDIEYCSGSIDMIDRLNSGEHADAVFLSNSLWMSMLDTKACKITDYDVVSINPIVFGVKKSKAEQLGLIKDELYLRDIVSAVQEGKLKFTMPSGTQTNTGASSLLGFVSTLCGNPEVLTLENIQDEKLSQDLIGLFSGVSKASGSESFIEELYLAGKCEAAILYETSIININKQIKNEDDIIYALYPCDGVSISDLIFGYIDNGSSVKKDIFADLKNYIFSEEVQQKLEKNGHRVWYGGINESADKIVFNEAWGIDTSKYITPIKYPSLEVIHNIFGMYQSDLRKPTHTIFALDYSGSMYGEGYKQLVDAMEYILDKDKASKDYLQFSDDDIVTIIPFSTYVIDTYSTSQGKSLSDLIYEIKNTKVSGGTNIYDSITEGLNILKNTDSDKYNVTIVVMTDGVGNNGSEKDMINTYNLIGKDIPVYSILFGDASQNQMQKIAELTGGKVFDGKENLKYAFKLVRGYN